MIRLGSYAKINLSLDVIGRRPDGYHNIESVMQGIGLHDDFAISGGVLDPKVAWDEIDLEGITLRVHFDSETPESLPPLESNLVTKAVATFLQKLKALEVTDEKLLGVPSTISIIVDKKLPIAAGIAGGSGNAAVAMLGINKICGNPFNLKELMETGATIGADIPFSISMNALMNKGELGELNGVEAASVAALMEGIGDVVTPIQPIERTVIIMNPGIAVSTKEVYEAIDKLPRYNSEVRQNGMAGLWTNIMEEYTLNFYDEASKMADAMKKHLKADRILMSGSGPTIVAYYIDKKQAEKDYQEAILGNWTDSSWKVYITETGKVMV